MMKGMPRPASRFLMARTLGSPKPTPLITSKTAEVRRAPMSSGTISTRSGSGRLLYPRAVSKPDRWVHRDPQAKDLSFKSGFNQDPRTRKESWPAMSAFI